MPNQWTPLPIEQGGTGGTTPLSARRALGLQVPTGGAANVNFLPAGAGAVARSVQDKARDILALADYDTLAHFNTAVAALPNTGIYTFGGLLNAQGFSSLVSGGGKIWFGINTIPTTGTFEIGDTPLSAFKVVGLSGQTDTVEIALVQNQGGLRTYGALLLCVATTSDFTIGRRVNLVDTEVMRFANATGNVGIVGNGSLAAPVSFRFNIARAAAGDTTEIGLFSATNTVVGAIGIDGAVTNDLRVASIGDIHFYPGSTIVAGSTPTNEKMKITAAGQLTGMTTIKPAASGYLSSDGTVGLTQASTTTVGKSITVKDGLVVAFA